MKCASAASDISPESEKSKLPLPREANFTESANILSIVSDCGEKRESQIAESGELTPS